MQNRGENSVVARYSCLECDQIEEFQQLLIEHEQTFLDRPCASDRNIHVRGYQEQLTITTPFDMAVLNDLDRFHLAADALARLPHLGLRGDAFHPPATAADSASRLHPRARRGSPGDSRMEMA